MKKLQEGDKIHLLRDDHNIFKRGEVLVLQQWAEKTNDDFRMGYFLTEKGDRAGYLILRAGNRSLEGKDYMRVAQEVPQEAVQEKKAPRASQKAASVEEARPAYSVKEPAVNTSMSDLIAEIKQIDNDIQEWVEERQRRVDHLASQLSELGLDVKTALPTAAPALKQLAYASADEPEAEDMSDVQNWVAGDMVRSLVTTRDNPALTKGRQYRLKSDPTPSGKGHILDDKGQIVLTNLNQFEWIS